MVDKYVCAKCFSNNAIKEFIEENTFSNKCSYCPNESDEPIAAPLEDVIEFIRDGIETEWDDPTNCVGWESAEGGWQGATVVDSFELIKVEIEELQNTNETVLDDIANSLDQEWCQRDPYGLPKDEALTLSWTEFTEQVKHHVRYIFLKLEESQDTLNDLDIIPVSKMLDRLSDELSTLEDDGVLSTIQIGMKIFRTRIHQNTRSFTNANEMGTVPLEHAKYANRMSPAGIPMFYGAFDPETALLETVDDADISACKVASTGAFQVIKKMEVLDLTKTFQFPSIFDQNRGHLRSTLIFLRNFKEEISKPIRKNGAEHIEYVPSQIFTEYIRHIYKDQSNNNIEGILYPSTKRTGGVCCVLFIENQHCCDIGNASDKHYLLLEGIERRQL